MFRGLNMKANENFILRNTIDNDIKKRSRKIAVFRKVTSKLAIYIGLHQLSDLRTICNWIQTITEKSD